MKIKMLQTVSDVNSYGPAELDAARKLAAALGATVKETEPAPGVTILKFTSHLRSGGVYDVPDSQGANLVALGYAETVEAK